MSTLIRLEHLSAEVRLPDGERLTTVDDVSASFERGTSTAITTVTGKSTESANQSRLHRRAAQQRL